MYDPTRLTTDYLHAISSLLLVDVDDSVTEGVRAVLSALHHSGRLDRLVFEDAVSIIRRERATRKGKEKKEAKS